MANLIERTENDRLETVRQIIEEELEIVRQWKEELKSYKRFKRFSTMWDEQRIKNALKMHKETLESIRGSKRRRIG